VRGYEQIKGKSYYNDSIAAPVTNANSVRIVWVLMATNPDWIAKIVDVEGAFLQGKFINGEVMYIEEPDRDRTILRKARRCRVAAQRTNLRDKTGSFLFLHNIGGQN
jgi:hypothetical protein